MSYSTTCGGHSRACRGSCHGTAYPVFPTFPSRYGKFRYLFAILLGTEVEKRMAIGESVCLSRQYLGCWGKTNARTVRALQSGCRPIICASPRYVPQRRNGVAAPSVVQQRINIATGHSALVDAGCTTEQSLSIRPTGCHKCCIIRLANLGLSTGVS